MGLSNEEVNGGTSNEKEGENVAENNEVATITQPLSQLAFLASESVKKGIEV